MYIFSSLFLTILLNTFACGDVQEDADNDFKVVVEVVIVWFLIVMQCGV